ncbi:transglycosylase SLT domain-containing protein [Lysobacter korlensis]|uniref:Transglycosylase SLT domain-containing protein n=1 Tax=Lysobacter korlensis TaxID=553636 RepID=A0ABV6RQB2_9GAMM
MSALVRLPGRLAPLAFATLAALSFEADALSRRDQAAVDALNQRMQAAEARYREALVDAANAGPDARKAADAALEDMEDAITACGKQRGCSMQNMLASFKRLLKANSDAPRTDEDIDTTLVDETPESGSVPDSAAAAALLTPDGERFKQMVQYNPAVQAGIRRWLTDMRVTLIQSHENYQHMQHLMSPAFKRSGLPEALLFGIMAKESNGKVHVGSRAGAVGPLQFMPATGKRFGLGPDGTGFDTRYDPQAAANAAAAYLNERFRELDSNIEMSLAAYNGGEGRARRVYRESGGRSFWDADVYNQFPAETKDYVPMVIAAAWLYLHPKEYGLTFPKVDTRPATIRLARSASIYELTICLGNGGTRDGYMRVLRNLNPRFEADQMIPAGTSMNVTTKMVGLYNRWCTQGQRADLARTLVTSDPNTAIVRRGAAVPVPPIAPPPKVEAPAPDAKPEPTASATRPARDKKPAAPREYKVQPGETLTSIASKFECKIGALADANKVPAPRYMIRPGQRLKLDGCGS